VALPADVRERVARERAAGRSLAAIADGLTDDQVATAQGGVRWHPSTVRHVLAMIKREQESVSHA
jgi:Recombinase